jgi:hypothetical protein
MICLQIISSPSQSVLFAVDTSTIVYHLDSNYFQNSNNDVFTDVSSWFKANKLTLNFDRVNFMRFATNNKTYQF